MLTRALGKSPALTLDRATGNEPADIPKPTCRRFTPETAPAWPPTIVAPPEVTMNSAAQGEFHRRYRRGTQPSMLSANRPCHTATSTAPCRPRRLCDRPEWLRRACQPQVRSRRTYRRRPSVPPLDPISSMLSGRKQEIRRSFVPAGQFDVRLVRHRHAERASGE